MDSLNDGQTEWTTTASGPEATAQEEEEGAAAGIAAGAGKAGRHLATRDHGGGNQNPDRIC